MKIKNILTSTLLLSTLSSVAMALSSCSPTFVSTNQTNTSNYSTSDNASYVNVTFKAHDGQTGVTFSGSTVVRIKKGKLFASVSKPIATKSGYIYDYWEDSNHKKIESTTIINENINVYPHFGQDVELNECLGIQAIQDSYVSIVTHGIKEQPNISYSSNGLSWTTYTSGKSLTLKSGEILYFKGYNDKGFSFSEGNYTTFSIGGKVSLTGNVMTLLNGGESDDKPETKDYIPSSYCFYKLFDGCSGIVSIPTGFLPATHLKPYSYAYMFNDCASLASFPTTLLPDTQLDDGDGQYTGERCYFSMFMNCPKIKSVPVGLLPAETLSPYCYDSMFSGCSGLTELKNESNNKVLPATTLANGCYSSMFDTCQNLETIDNDLLSHVTTFAQSCYSSMFATCTSLTDLSSLSICKSNSELKAYCFDQMFYGCTALTNAPALPASTCAQGCYSAMFYNCSSLTDSGMPELPATTLHYNCYQYMFYNCTTLQTIYKLFDFDTALTLQPYCYAEMFRGCTGLKDLSEIKLNSKLLKDHCYYRMFYGCTSMTKTPDFTHDTGSEMAPYCCSQMFYKCSSLTASPKLTWSYAAEHCYEQMFGYCTSLKIVNQIGISTFKHYSTPATGALQQMFDHCSSLRMKGVAPSSNESNDDVLIFQFPAGSDGESGACYDYASNMFQYCLDKDGNRRKGMTPWWRYKYYYVTY